MRGLEELQPTPLLERDLPVGQLDLEVGRHVARTEEHCHLAQRHPTLVELQHAVDDEARLLGLVLRGDEPGFLTAVARRPEILREPLLGARDQRVGEREDRCRGAIVLGERDERRAGKRLRKVEDVAEVRTAERVDALRVVADDGDPAMRRAHAAEDARLEQVGVLVLVDEHVVVQAGDARREGRRRLEHRRPEQQEVVVVDEVPLLLPQCVVGEERDDLLLVLEEVRHLAVQQLVERELGVDVPRVEVVQRLLLRKPLRRLREAERTTGELHEVLRVALVHDREVGRQSRGPTELAQKPVADGMERPSVDACAAGPHQPLGAREHLARGAPGEREEEDALGRHSPFDEVSDAMDERASLARSGAGDDEQRRVLERDGASLIGIEPGDQRLRVVRGEIPRTRAVEARLVGHGRQYRCRPE